MPISAGPPAHDPCASADPSIQDSDSEAEPSVDDDEEYEEIEEEVEVEEEVLVEEEVEEDEEEIGEDLSPVYEDRNYISQFMECKGNEENLRSGYSNPQKAVAYLPPDAHAVEGCGGNSKISALSETRQEESHVDCEDLTYPNIGNHIVPFEDYELEESAANKNDSGALAGKRTSKNHECKASPCDRGIMNETTKPFSISGEEVTAAILIRDGFGKEANGFQYSEEEIKQTGTQSGEDFKQRASRLAVPQTRPRSLSPGTNFGDGNKRPAVMCDFFAKGWCIKGNTCRFLHVKDHEDGTSQLHEGAVAAENQKSKLQADEGLKDGTKKSVLPGFPDAAASSVAHGIMSSSERIPAWDHRQSPSWKSGSLDLPLHKDNPGSILGKSSIRHNWYFDNYGNYVSPIVKGSSPLYKNSSLHGTFSSSSIMSSDNRSIGISSYAPSLEEMASKRSQLMLNDRSLLVSNRSLSPSSSTSLPATGIVTSNHISSPFSGSESENLSRTYVSWHPLLSAGNKTKVSSYDWEPSVPFRPSFFVTRSLSSPGSQYDPLCDSIEQPNLGDGFSKFSCSSQGKSIAGTHWRINDHILKQTLGAEHSSDKHSISGHQKVHGSMLDKNFNGRDFCATETETVGTDVAERQSRNNFTREDKSLSPAHVKEITNANKISIDCTSRLQNDGSKYKTGSKVDNTRQNNEMDVDLETDADVHKESKVLKYFRAALIDFVKELVKPTWREGHLSKDAHKIIVKKAVDKVLSAFEPHQIPSTTESIKQYLSSSQSKIAKLVEGYIDKYGKS